MPFLNHDVLDDGLSVLSNATDRVDVCSAEPATYAEATGTLSLGRKLGHSVAAPVDGVPDGRQVESAAVGDGAITGTGTASHYALVDTTSSRLLAAGALTNPQVVTDGNDFTLTPFTIRIPDPQ
ncbi:MAG: hypothetical protein LC687_06130 [Actinobacteria bacterium]|nr:hypothetical protein [Actinomycetota bacterium]MCA1807405.1 hypothetical protein [Actinomycetota bacterium]